ncbi:MAG: MarR family transcriptional regulator [Alteraurantiacibacter sp.]
MTQETGPAYMATLYRRPGFMIRRAHQISLALFEEAAQEFGITTTQFSVLHTLRAWPEIDQVSLCTLIGLDRSTATLVLTTLERNALIERRQDPDDKRRNLLVLSPQGRALLERTTPLATAISGPMGEVLSEAELEQMCALLGRFVAAYNERVRTPLLKDFVPQGRKNSAEAQ